MKSERSIKAIKCYLKKRDCDEYDPYFGECKISSGFCKFPEGIRAELEVLEKQQSEIEKRIAEIKKNCKHKWKKNDFGGACCVICGGDFGWLCPNSPDGVCHYMYRERDGKKFVKLINDEEVEIEVEDRDLCDYDDCIFCHEPEERK